MADFVIDANVWIVADRDLAHGMPQDLADCIEACRDFIMRFVYSSDRLVVDWGHRILTEYRNNIGKGGFAESLLNLLQQQSVARLSHFMLETDEDGGAVLPNGLTFADRADRKYIAAAIESEPYSPIFNATDTDWSKESEQLKNHGITVVELCPNLVASALDTR